MYDPAPPPAPELETRGPHSARFAICWPMGDGIQGQCVSCLGSGEAATDYGVVDCPDCGGAGTLPSRHTQIEWRAADIERVTQSGRSVEPEHVRWLLAELRSARAALTSILSLAHDTSDPDGIGLRIRFTANRALGLYEEGASPSSPSAEPPTKKGP